MYNIHRFNVRSVCYKNNLDRYNYAFVQNINISKKGKCSNIMYNGMLRNYVKKYLCNVSGTFKLRYESLVWCMWSNVAECRKLLSQSVTVKFES